MSVIKITQFGESYVYDIDHDPEVTSTDAPKNSLLKNTDWYCKLSDGDNTDVVKINTIKNNYAATTAPDGDNDITEGYSVGSNWVDVTANNVYTCVDSTEGEAEWPQTNSRRIGTIYTPGTQGFGTISNDDVVWMQQGLSNIYEVDGIFTSGTPSGSEAQIDLPNSKTIHASIGISRIVGTWALGRNTTAHGGFIIATAGDSFVNLSHREIFSTNTGTSHNSLTIETGSNVAVGSGDEVSFLFNVPITGL